MDVVLQLLSMTSLFQFELQKFQFLFEFSNFLISSPKKKKDTLKNAKNFYFDLKEREEPTSIVFVANKTDLIEDDLEEVSSQGRKFAESQKWPFFMASAKTGENVKEIFEEALRLATTSKVSEVHEEDSESPVIVIDPNPPKAGWCNC